MKRIPMIDLRIEYEYMKEEIDEAIRRCLEHQKWIFGPEVGELEKKMASYIGVKHCIGVSSGTDALVLSLRALAIKLKGTEYFDRTDEIITTPFTFTATGDAILRAGATPVFVDIDPVTYNIEPTIIEDYLKSESRGNVIGILPVHLYGQACQMDKINEIAEKYDLFVVEDVAQAFGGAWRGQKLGSLGDVGCFSFFPSKNLGCYGDAGMVSTNDDEIAEIVRMLLKHGGKEKYNVFHIGYNARMDTLQAAIILAKFKYVDDFNRRRRLIAEKYSSELKGCSALIIPNIYDQSHVYHVFHQYTVRVKDGKRDEVRSILKDRGIESMVYYPVPLHKMKVFNGRCKIFKGLKESERASREVLSLPIGPLMNEEDVVFVAKTIREILD